MNDQELIGMTVNERLFILGLAHRFDRAIKNRNREVSVSLLLEAKFTPEQAEETVSSIFKEPKKYCY
jgi:hypothetical protein